MNALKDGIEIPANMEIMRTQTINSTNVNPTLLSLIVTMYFAAKYLDSLTGLNFSIKINSFGDHFGRNFVRCPVSD